MLTVQLKATVDIEAATSVAYSRYPAQWLYRTYITQVSARKCRAAVCASRVSGGASWATPRNKF